MHLVIIQELNSLFVHPMLCRTQEDVAEALVEAAKRMWFEDVLGKMPEAPELILALFYSDRIPYTYKIFTDVDWWRPPSLSPKPPF